MGDGPRLGVIPEIGNTPDVEGGPDRGRPVADGEIMECESFLELLTAPPLKGFGEDPKRVEALLKDDAKALRLFRAATTAPPHKHTDSSNRTVRPRRGTTRAYTLDRLKRKAPDLYKRVVARELSAHAAAKAAGFSKEKSPLQQLLFWWRTSLEDRQEFLRTCVG